MTTSGGDKLTRDQKAPAMTGAFLYRNLAVSQTVTDLQRESKTVVFEQCRNRLTRHLDDGSKTRFLSMASRYGYVRVSTDHQTNDPQILALRREGLADDQIVQDVISGGVPALARPGMSGLIDQLQPGDSLVAAKLDRLGRDTIDVMGLIRTLNDRQINLRILNIGIETNTPNGRLFLTILAGFSEFEREIIRERTIAGLAAAREAGIKLGRKPKLTAKQKFHALELSKGGLSNDLQGLDLNNPAPDCITFQPAQGPLPRYFLACVEGYACHKTDTQDSSKSPFLSMS